MRTTPREKIEAFTEAGWWGQDTLSSIFQETLAAAPDDLALCDPINRGDLVGGVALRLSFRELDSKVDHVARRLFEAGLRQDDKILVQMPNVAEIVFVYLAAARLGLIVSPVAMQYGHHELEHICGVIEPKAYIAFIDFRGEPFGQAQSPILNEDCQLLLFGEEGDFQTEPAQSGDYDVYIEGVEITANDIFTICWTSGTTGRSKGVPRSHNHWLSSTLASEDAIQLGMGAVMLNPFPFINMAAIGGFLYYWLKIRGQLVLHHPFDPMVFLSQLQNEKAEYTIAPPAVLTRLLQTKDQIKAGFDLSALRIIGSGSAPLSPAMITGFKEEFGIDVVNIFGSNEGMAILSGAVDVPDSVERASFFPRFGRTEHEWANRISKRIKTKLVNPETGDEITTPGVSGECHISGATVFDGYYNSPDDNAEAFAEDGYFRTGDLFEIAGDNNEFYRFVGRCKSLIVRGGVNISPEELDELISSHPKVAEGVAAAYSDAVMGEKICAVVVLHDGEDLSLEQLNAFMSQKKVAKFKWPERLHIMKALPRNAMNKVVRRELETLIA
ncbi:AMP-dependent acyl-CoA synthetase [Litorimonas cladophorae]|uniref:AMP-dependent acyl-CoA synthetase n=1 Tax=Litorimonas cladophorae TaxID=1220491 RepID=A0A918NH81_9PROT|nr:class I adenylate-forming enzyme family protein [Litorimonas cladophorae]GGX70260.1 AMP-dependent acyl-CoA synthetase [Litorimonas cladophorae]